MCRNCQTNVFYLRTVGYLHGECVRNTIHLSILRLLKSGRAILKCEGTVPVITHGKHMVREIWTT